MKLAIITVNYNTANETIRLLESLKDQTDQNFEVFIIDNCSAPEDKETLENYIRDNYSAVFYNPQKKNLGFSGGNNMGTNKALENGAEWVVFLNNDTWLQNDFIAALRPILSQKEGILGLPIDEGGHIVFGGRITWLKETLPHNLRLTVSDPDVYAVGGAMAIHKDVFRDIGYLDEKYFLYFEDADFSLRARDKDIAVEILSKPVVSHSVSASTKKLGSPKLLYYHYRNAMIFNLRHGSLITKILVLFWGLWVISKQILKLATGRKIRESKYILKGITDFYTGKHGHI